MGKNNNTRKLNKKNKSIKGNKPKRNYTRKQKGGIPLPENDFSNIQKLIKDFTEITVNYHKEFYPEYEINVKVEEKMNKIKMYLGGTNKSPKKKWKTDTKNLKSYFKKNNKLYSWLDFNKQWKKESGTLRSNSSQDVNE